MQLITSRQGKPHVTVEQAAAQNSSFMGGANGIFYNTFTPPEIVSNTRISMKAVTGMIQGRVFNVGKFDTDAVNIAEGVQSLKRRDIICVKVTVDPVEGTQSASWAVVKGESSTNPQLPIVLVQDLDNGALESNLPFAIVDLDGINITDITMVAERLDIAKTTDIYPVGSIYMSLNETNPGNLFGGTWERISGKFLLGADDDYASGTTGGSDNHVHLLNGDSNFAQIQVSGNNLYLTPKSLPKATDSWYESKKYNYTTTKHLVTSSSVSDGSTVHTAGVPLVGQTNKAAKPILPPYLSVYMWKRIA